MFGLAYLSSLSSRKYSLPSRPRPRFCAQPWTECSHRGNSRRRILVIGGKGCYAVGHLSSSVVMGSLEVMDVISDCPP